ncbi:exportin-T-like isoform X1 [Thrips palmi]|uniref:Exportin-T n=1 Tax=Thrips palmi TaxID=161013 RepID=A0A6P8Y3Y2_THRPL|nr:exportin-T-like isoform X1 [Thrips palmi]
MDQQILGVTMSLPMGSIGSLGPGVGDGGLGVNMNGANWRMCLNELVGERASLLDAQTKFLYLKVLEVYIQTQYGNAPSEEQIELRQYLLRWIVLQCSQQISEQKFIRNKMGQIFSLVFVKDFPHRWPSFFGDLVGTLSFGRVAVEFFLVVLSAMDTEVFSPKYNRSDDLIRRSTQLKDTMREASVQVLVDSWFQILTTWHSEPDIVTACLEVTSVYVPWIDVTTVANDKFLPVVLQLMRNEYARAAAADLLCQVVDKGMDNLDKLQLITRMLVLLRNFQVPLLPSQVDSVAYTANMANLVNSIGLNLLEASDRLKEKGAVEAAEVAFNAAEENILYMDGYLQHNEENVCLKVTRYAKEYIRKLKGKALAEKQIQIVQKLLKTVVDKLKLHSDYFSTSNEDRQQSLLDFRNEFKILFVNLLAIDKDLVCQCVYQVVTGVLKDLQAYSTSEVECVIYILYVLGEALPSAGSSPPQNNQETQSANNLIRLMLLELLSSGVSNYPDSSVKLQFLETVSRRDKLFLKETELIPPVLEAFLDHRGLRSSDKKLRARSAFLFQLFVKSLRSTLATFSYQVIASLKDFLELSSAQSNGTWLCHEDQLHLYGAVGLLIVSGTNSPEEKGETIRNLLVPVVARYQELSAQLMTEQNDEQRAVLAHSMCHAMAVVTGVSKAFNNLKDTRMLGCFQLYYEVLQVFLTCLQSPNQKELLQSGLRQFLHRMVVCLEGEVLPVIPFVLQAILRDNDAFLLSEFMPLVLQVIMKFKKDAASLVQQLLAPTLAIFTAAWAADTDKDNPYAQEENHYLFRSFLGLISAIVTNNILEVLLAQEPHTLQQALDWVIQGTYHDPDPTAQKSCYTILRKMVDQWGGVGEKPDGFTEFLYERVVPACYLPLKSLDDTSPDSRAVGKECSQLIASIFKKRGDEFLCHLQNTFLPSLGLEPRICEAHIKTIREGKNIYQNCIEVVHCADEAAVSRGGIRHHVSK